MKKILYLFFAVCVLISCNNENDVSDVVIILKSGSVKEYVRSGDMLRYEIESFSNKSVLTNFKASTFDSEYGEKLLLDSALNQEKIEFTFLYKAPAFSKDSVSTILKFEASDAENKTRTYNCTIVVTSNADILPEKSGIILYSALSGKQDAFSLENPSQVFLAALADSAKIDVYDFNESSNETFVREWRTNTDVGFVKANSFDYASATANSVRQTYIASVRQNYVSDIQTNDIILIGKEKNATGVIIITDVVDSEGAGNDFYRFNYKQVQ